MVTVTAVDRDIDADGDRDDRRAHRVGTTPY